MADSAENKLAPIIIKKIKKGHHGHHGGAWKVAYADFVTAMMAFFLLLWLLASTTPEQRLGLADYFTPTVGLKDSKGIGFEGGLTPNEEGASKTTLADPGLVAGQINQATTPSTDPSSQDAIPNPEAEDTGAPPIDSEPAPKPETQPNDAAIKEAEEKLREMLEQTPELAQIKKDIIITNTPEGLKIDVVEDPEKPMFMPGTAVMTDVGRLIFRSISGVILRTNNQISLTGHTEEVNYPPGSTYTGWELSADRANSTRRFLTENLLEQERIAKVLGMADHDLLLPKEPQSPRNRRITIMLLRNSQMVNAQPPANRGLLASPKADTQSVQPKEEAPPPPPAPAPKSESPAIFTPQKKVEEGKGFAVPPAGEDGKPVFQDAAPVKPVELPKPAPVEQPPAPVPEVKDPGMFAPQSSTGGNTFEAPAPGALEGQKPLAPVALPKGEKPKEKGEPAASGSPLFDPAATGPQR